MSNLPSKSPNWGTFNHVKPPIWGFGGLKAEVFGGEKIRRFSCNYNPISIYETKL
jgi:hypothetical protein